MKGNASTCPVIAVFILRWNLYEDIASHKESIDSLSFNGQNPTAKCSQDFLYIPCFQNRVWVLVFYPCIVGVKDFTYER